MDFQSASTELTSADKTGGFDSPVEQGKAESLKSSLTADQETRKEKPERLRQWWPSKRSKSSVNQRSIIAGLATKVPFYLIAILLSATAMAKIWMLLTDPFADIRVGIPKEILWITVVFELWVAFENWRIRDHRVLALINTLTFAIFAIFAGTRWAQGYTSCGCAGSMEFPPWTFMMLDLSIVTWFLSSTARRSVEFDGALELLNWWNGWSSGAKGRLAGLILFVSCLGFVQLPIAAPIRAAVLSEPPIQPIVQFNGELVVGIESIVEVEIWNRFMRPVKIVGMQRSCNCIELPKGTIGEIISGNGRFSLPLVVTPKKSGPMHQRIVLFLDHPLQFRMNIDVLGSTKGEK